MTEQLEGDDGGKVGEGSSERRMPDADVLLVVPKATLAHRLVSTNGDGRCVGLGLATVDVAIERFAGAATN